MKENKYEISHSSAHILLWFFQLFPVGSLLLMASIKGSLSNFYNKLLAGEPLPGITYLVLETQAYWIIVAVLLLIFSIIVHLRKMRRFYFITLALTFILTIFSWFVFAVGLLIPFVWMSEH